MNNRNQSEEKTDWNIVGYILSSEIRLKILELLNGNKHTPSQMKNELNISMSHISNELRSLRRKGLVECINPNNKKGRIYQLTEYGKTTYKVTISIKMKVNLEKR